MTRPEDVCPELDRSFDLRLEHVPLAVDFAGGEDRLQELLDRQVVVRGEPVGGLEQVDHRAEFSGMDREVMDRRSALEALAVLSLLVVLQTVEGREEQSAVVEQDEVEAADGAVGLGPMQLRHGVTPFKVSRFW